MKLESIICPRWESLASSITGTLIKSLTRTSALDLRGNKKFGSGYTDVSVERTLSQIRNLRVAFHEAIQYMTSNNKKQESWSRLDFLFVRVLQ